MQRRVRTQMTTDEAIQRLFDKCANLEAANFAQLSINKLLLQAIADMNEGSHQIISAELRKFAEKNPDEFVAEILNAMADSLVDSYSSTHPEEPRLSLVPSPHQGSGSDDPKNE